LVCRWWLVPFFESGSGHEIFHPVCSAARARGHNQLQRRCYHWLVTLLPDLLLQVHKS